LKNQETGCDGGCQDDYDDEYGYSDDEPDRDEDDENEEAIRAAEEASTEQSTPPVRNLDGGSSRYWEHQDIDFGDEPTETIQDRSWDCDHNFTAAKVSLTDSLKAPPTGMECMKCWAPIQPEVQMPNNINTCGVRTVANADSALLLHRRHGRHGRGARGGGGATAARVQPYLHGNPFRESDNTRPDSVPDFFESHSQPNAFSFKNPFLQTAPANGVYVVDTYGNTLRTTETPASPRRASEDVIMQDRENGTDRRPEWMIGVVPARSPSQASRAELEAAPPSGSSSPPPGFHKHEVATSSTRFSFAYQCYECDLLVCENCREKLEDAQEEKQMEEDEAARAKYEAARQQPTNAAIQMPIFR
jgi:hypothetical protein